MTTSPTAVDNVSTIMAAADQILAAFKEGTCDLVPVPASAVVAAANAEGIGNRCTPTEHHEDENPTRADDDHAVLSAHTNRLYSQSSQVSFEDEHSGNDLNKIASASSLVSSDKSHPEQQPIEMAVPPVKHVSFRSVALPADTCTQLQHRQGKAQERESSSPCLGKRTRSCGSDDPQGPVLQRPRLPDQSQDPTEATKSPRSVVKKPVAVMAKAHQPLPKTETDSQRQACEKSKSQSTGEATSQRCLPFLVQGPPPDQSRTGREQVRDLKAQPPSGYLAQPSSRLSCHVEAPLQPQVQCPTQAQHQQLPARSQDLLPTLTAQPQHQDHNTCPQAPKQSSNTFSLSYLAPQVHSWMLQQGHLQVLPPGSSSWQSPQNNFTKNLPQLFPKPSPSQQQPQPFHSTATATIAADSSTLAASKLKTPPKKAKKACILKKPSLPCPSTSSATVATLTEAKPTQPTSGIPKEIAQDWRNQKMKPTDCLLFAASLLQEAPTTAASDTATTAQLAASSHPSHHDYTISTPHSFATAHQHATNTTAAAAQHQYQDNAQNSVPKLPLPLNPQQQQNQPCELDVLCGRGGLINKHVGKFLSIACDVSNF
jgi:hypothetical protein